MILLEIFTVLQKEQKRVQTSNTTAGHLEKPSRIWEQECSFSAPKTTPNWKISKALIYFISTKISLTKHYLGYSNSTHFIFFMVKWKKLPRSCFTSLIINLGWLCPLAWGLVNIWRYLQLSQGGREWGTVGATVI